VSNDGADVDSAYSIDSGKTLILLMRRIKRVLIFASEIGVLLLGLVVSIALGGLVDRFTSFDSDLALLTFGCGLLLTAVGFLLLLRKHRAAKFEYEVVGWEINRADRKLNARRAQFQRNVRRTMVWVPSAIAALALFFYPVASHLLHPGSRYLRYYRVPIPWTVTVLSTVYSWPELAPDYSRVEALVSDKALGRFGITPFWDRGALSSTMGFASMNPEGSYGYSDQPEPAIPQGATEVTSREFRLGTVALTCWQYVLPYRRGWPDGTGPWEVSCLAPEDVHQFNFQSWFYGEKSDLPLFYRIIEGVTPVE
jgi:hypothetical protein